MLKKSILASIGLAIALIAAPGAQAATIVILNADGPGEGFNDPTPVDPVGFNPGTTLGEQRLNAFQFAADIWGSVLESDVEIVITSLFEPLFCSEFGATLGSAGATAIWSNFPNAPFPDTWYHAALADSLAGGDLEPGFDDMISFYNSNLDLGCLYGISGWYYGLDGNSPPDRFDIVVVLLHEFAHGLGFANFVNETDGAFIQGLPDVYSHFTFDNEAGKTWAGMQTDSERVLSAINTDDVIWNGTHVTANVPVTLNAGKAVLAIESPAGLAGPMVIRTDVAAANFTEAGVTAPVEPVDDGVDDPADGCTALNGFTPGNIALIDRGECSYLNKILNAEAAGASGVIIVNNAPGNTPPVLGGVTGTAIPAASISQADGAAIKAALQNGPVVATMERRTNAYTGSDAEGFALIYAPDPLQTGSSLSHWDTSATPNLLMEPSINFDLDYGLDMTPALLKDVGWELQEAPEAPALDRGGEIAMALVFLVSGCVFILMGRRRADNAA